MKLEEAQEFLNVQKTLSIEIQGTFQACKKDYEAQIQELNAAVQEQMKIASDSKIEIQKLENGNFSKELEKKEVMQKRDDLDYQYTMLKVDYSKIETRIKTLEEENIKLQLFLSDSKLENEGLKMKVKEASEGSKLVEQAGVKNSSPNSALQQKQASSAQKKNNQQQMFQQSADSILVAAPSSSLPAPIVKQPSPAAVAAAAQSQAQQQQHNNACSVCSKTRYGLMIKCNSCDQSFHASCVKSGSTASVFTCATCKKSADASAQRKKRKLSLVDD